MADLAADYQLLRSGAGGLLLARDAVRVAGPDAPSFLQGQCSQDVANIKMAASAWSLVLQPQGKVDALVRITRVGEDSFVLDTDGGWGVALIQRLARFKLRVKVDIDPLASWSCVALRGPRSHALVAGLASQPDMVVADASWPGLEGVDLLGVSPAWPDGVPEVTDGAYQAVRIEAGVPAMGAELTDRTIPAEAGIVERTVSFTKGCFTGQELVARIDSRGGKVPRRLRGIVLATDAAPVGAALVLAGKQVGQLTSTAATPGGRAVALAYVSRDTEVPADAIAEWGGGQVAAGIRDLPLVR